MGATQGTEQPENKAETFPGVYIRSSKARMLTSNSPNFNYKQKGQKKKYSQLKKKKNTNL